ncbi:MAG: penicillin-binding transpeptidase domain-containing protein [Peptococcia bacterium]
MQQRIRGVLCICIGLLFVLIARTAYLQLWDGPNSGASLANKALRLRLQYLSGEEFNRGEILDRNMLSLTDSAVRPALVAFPLSIRDLSAVAQYLEKNLGLKAAETEKALERAQKYYGPRNPVILQVNLSSAEIEKFQGNTINGLAILPLKNRYGPNSLARHLIGHLNSIDERKWQSLGQARRTIEKNPDLPTAYRLTDKIGVAGLEERYENALRGSKSEYTLGGLADADGRLLQGLGYKIQPDQADSWRNHLILTLDREYQQIAEEVLDRHVTKGAVVVLDIATSDVLAVASRPNYDQNMVSKYLDGRDKLLDRSERVAFYPGSVFKVVVAAAALEENLCDLEEIFTCTGSYQFADGTEISCSRPHGEVDLNQAIIRSCNTTFIQLGQRLGNEKLRSYAEKLGITIHLKANSPPAFLGNSSIGQEGVLVSPLQIANLYATLAREGLYLPWRTVAEIRNYQSDLIQEYPQQAPQRVLQGRTCQLINQALIETARSGSGQLAWLKEYGSAGKTGTAQANNNNRVIAWYAGFAPAENPHLAIAVMVEEDKSGSSTGLRGGNTAAPIFREIAERILLKEGVIQ